MIGKVLRSYKIVSKIGEGGMGVVYLAENIGLKSDSQSKVFRLP